MKGDFAIPRPIFSYDGLTKVHEYAPFSSAANAGIEMAPQVLDIVRLIGINSSCEDGPEGALLSCDKGVRVWPEGAPLEN